MWNYPRVASKFAYFARIRVLQEKKGERPTAKVTFRKPLRSVGVITTRYSQGKMQPKRERERGNNSGYMPGCNGRSDRVAGFPVADGGSMSVVSGGR